MIWALVTVAGLDLALAPLAARWLRSGELSPRALGWLVAAHAGLAALLWVAFFALGLDLERDSTLLWSYCGLTAAAAGFVASLRLGRVPSRELFFTLVLVLEGALVAAVATHPAGGLASPPFRALLVAPAALPLAGYFGASLGFLTGGAAGLKPGYEGFVARRFLLSKGSPVLSAVTSISMIGVALGVWLVIVSLAVLSGFEYDLEQKIIGATAHIVVQTASGAPLAADGAAAAAIATTPGVAAASPVVEGEAAVSSSSNYTGALVFGVEPERATRVLGVLGKVVQGSLAPLAAATAPPPAEREDDGGEFPLPAALPGIVIGVEMAKGLNVGVGDTVRLISPILETMTPVGPAPKSAGFEIAAVFESKMYEYDARYAFTSLGAARRFFELGPQEVTAIQVAVGTPDLADRLAGDIATRLGDGYQALDWKRRNQTLFSALKLERVVAFVVLVFIILVASFAIVNTLTMAVIEKRKEIAILKTMGARDGGVMKVFLTQGLIVGAFGTAAGAAAGIGTVALLDSFGFRIPGDVYYIDRLPVHLEPLDVVVVVVAALLIVWDFAVFPALRGARLAPVEGLRDA